MQQSMWRICCIHSNLRPINDINNNNSDDDDDDDVLAIMYIICGHYRGSEITIE